MDLLINCHRVSKSFGQRPLFTDISLGLFADTRLGLIGSNGAGKSTFLKILAGLEMADIGEVAVKKDCSLCYLGQSDDFPPQATIEEVMHNGLAAEKIAEDEKYIRWHYALSEAGFTDETVQVATLSGGWKKRLSIAVAISRKPDLLFLDEPTNHLDIEGILWLEKFLQKADFAYVVVSHDRYFLCQATRQILELNRCYPGGYFLVKGNYEEFLAKKLDFLESQKALEDSLNSRLRLENAWLQRGARARSTKARYRVEEVARRQEMLSELSTRNRDSKTAGISLNATGRKTKKLLWAENISKSFANRQLFSLAEFQLGPTDCVGILGANGSGKTTLLNVLSGSIKTDSGQVQTADNLKIVVFTQDRSSLQPEETLKEALCPLGDSICFRGVEVHYTSWAARFLFEKEQLQMPVKYLSGGEQSRVLLARMMQEPADILFLDEPTNDLDIATLEILERNLEDFAGAVVLVTHDRSMLDRLATEIIGLDGQGNAAIYADFMQWHKKSSEPTLDVHKDKSGRKPVAVRARRLSFQEQKELETMEETILTAEVELEDMKNLLQSEALLKDGLRLQELCLKLQDKQVEIEALYDRWHELEQVKQGS